MSVEPASLQGLNLTELMQPLFTGGTGLAADASVFDELKFQDIIEKLCDDRITESDQGAPGKIEARDNPITESMEDMDIGTIELLTCTGALSDDSQSCLTAGQPEQKNVNINSALVAKSTDLFSQIYKTDANMAPSFSDNSGGEGVLAPEKLQPLNPREHKSHPLQEISSDTGNELVAKSPVLSDSNLTISGPPKSGVHSSPDLLHNTIAAHIRVTESNSTTFRMGFNGQFTQAVADLPELGQIVIRMQRNDAGVLVNLAAGSEQLPVLNVHADVLQRLIADTLLPNEQVHSGTGAYPEAHHGNPPLHQGTEVRLSFSEHQGNHGNSPQPPSCFNETPDSALPGFSIPLSADTRSFLRPVAGLIDVRV